MFSLPSVICRQASVLSSDLWGNGERVLSLKLALGSVVCLLLLVSCISSLSVFHWSPCSPSASGTSSLQWLLPLHEFVGSPLPGYSLHWTRVSCLSLPILNLNNDAFVLSGANTQSGPYSQSTANRNSFPHTHCDPLRCTPWPPFRKRSYLVSWVTCQIVCRS